MTLTQESRAPTFLDVHRAHAKNILAYPFEGVVTYQQIKSNPSTRTALHQLESIAETLLGPSKHTEYENIVGSNILQYCIHQPMIVQQLPGYSHLESVRFMLHDIKGFTDFVAFRNDPRKKSPQWIPRFHPDSKIFATNIIGPTFDKPPEKYTEHEWSVDRYDTVVPGIKVELAETMGFVTQDGGWLFPSGEHFKCINWQD